MVGRWLRSLGAMGLGLGTLGVGSYLLLVTLARQADAADVAAMGVFWSVTFGLLAGLFAPCEQLVARAVAERSSVGRAHLAVSQILALYVGGAVACGLVVLVLRDRLAAEWLGGQTALADAIAILFPVMAVQSAQRGLLAGEQRLQTYAGQLVVDGLGRGAWCLVLLVSDSPTAGLAAWGVVAAAGASVLLTPWAAVQREPFRRWGDVLKDAGSLSAGSTVSTVVLNAGPALVVGSGVPTLQAASFAAVFVITRIPLFLLATSQAVLIPWLGSAWHELDRTALRARCRLGLTVLGGVAVATVLVLGGLVNVWTGLLYGDEFHLRPLLGLGLALSTGLVLMAGVFQAVLLVAGRPRAIAAAWAGAAAVFLAVALAGPRPGPVNVVSAYVCCALGLLVAEGAVAGRVTR